MYILNSYNILFKVIGLDTLFECRRLRINLQFIDGLLSNKTNTIFPTIQLFI